MNTTHSKTSFAPALDHRLPANFPALSQAILAMDKTSGAPSSEAVVLSALMVVLAAVLLAAFLAGPAPAWDRDEGWDEGWAYASLGERRPT